MKAVELLLAAFKNPTPSVEDPNLQFIEIGQPAAIAARDYLVPLMESQRDAKPFFSLPQRTRVTHISTDEASELLNSLAASKAGGLWSNKLWKLELKIKNVLEKEAANRGAQSNAMGGKRRPRKTRRYTRRR